jgi:hypothetical protein
MLHIKAFSALLGWFRLKIAIASLAERSFRDFHAFG